MTKTQVWVRIENEGEIDLAALHLMGVSSKRGDDSKIGFFGSGNKYAIALLLREKIPFKIFSGENEIRIKTKPVMFRGSLYEQIKVNGKDTSLTTSMGPDWETWFAIRELYCNAFDEGNAKLDLGKELKGSKGKTTIFVGLTENLSDFFKNISRYILIGKDKFTARSITKYGKVELLNKEGEEFICYRKGVRITPKNSQKCIYWYNFDSIEINESRTYKYEHEVLERIASFFAVTQRKDLIEMYLTNWKGNYEENAKWEYVSDKLSDMWHAVLFGHRVYPENLAIRSGDFEGKLNSFIVPNKLADKIAEQFDDIEVVGSKGKKEFIELDMTESEKALFNTAKQELESIGYKINSRIVLAEALTSDVIAWYDRQTDIIYHTRKQLHGITELKNTLLEEHFHAIGHEDGQREFVTFLIDELIKAKS